MTCFCAVLIALLMQGNSSCSVISLSIQQKCIFNGLNHSESVGKGEYIVEGQAAKVVCFTKLCDSQISCCHLFYFKSYIPLSAILEIWLDNFASCFVLL